MFVLYLNDKRSKNTTPTPVARAETYDELNEFMIAEYSAPYKEGKFHKTFRKGGHLEWYNRPFIQTECILKVPDLDEYLLVQKQKYYDQMAEIPQVGIDVLKTVKNIFLFKVGTGFVNHYAVVYGTSPEHCMEKMTDKHNNNWSFQYPTEDAACVKQFKLKLLDIIE